MTNRGTLGPESDLESFAKAISSASDLQLASWQESGLLHPRTHGGFVVWWILTVSAVLGLVVAIAGIHYLVQPLMSLLFAPFHQGRGRGPGMIIHVAGLLSMNSIARVG